MNKFLEKNKESIEKMDAYIEMNKHTIRRMLTSVELFEYLKILINEQDNDMDCIMYKGIMVGKDSYYPANKVGFVMKNLEIEFDVPCVCGYYEGEGHRLVHKCDESNK
jgi:hypothetical protein